jgi:hypothetical protein
MWALLDAGIACSTTCTATSVGYMKSNVRLVDLTLSEEELCLSRTTIAFSKDSRIVSQLQETNNSVASTSYSEGGLVCCETVGLMADNALSSAFTIASKASDTVLAFIQLSMSKQIQQVSHRMQGKPIQNQNKSNSNKSDATAISKNSSNLNSQKTDERQQDDNDA